jgi:hypothetical protein
VTAVAGASAKSSLAAKPVGELFEETSAFKRDYADRQADFQAETEAEVPKPKPPRRKPPASRRSPSARPAPT